MINNAYELMFISIILWVASIENRLEPNLIWNIIIWILVILWFVFFLKGTSNKSSQMNQNGK